MEQKLAEFRARKMKHQEERDETENGVGETESSGRRYIRAAKEKLHSLYERWRSKRREDSSVPQINSLETQALQTSPAIPTEDQTEDFIPPPQNSLQTVTLLIKFLLWLVLLCLFIELEFGMAYFILSMFYWLYEGTRAPRARRKGEKSAYSVFNPGCEAIQGTLTAEQFERELQYRPTAGL
ncbi:SAYSvFN domain-containing protein 1 [Rhinophrynus dorsalis]